MSLQRELSRLFQRPARHAAETVKRYAIAPGGKAAPISKRGKLWTVLIAGQRFTNSRLGDLKAQLAEKGFYVIP